MYKAAQTPWLTPSSRILLMLSSVRKSSFPLDLNP